MLDEIFTALFGMVGMYTWAIYFYETRWVANNIIGVDFLLVMAMACVLKVRLERERYRIIDQKNGFKPI